MGRVKETEQNKFTRHRDYVDTEEIIALSLPAVIKSFS